MKTELQASITIEASAWDRVRSLATSKGRPLPMVIGELLEQALAEPETDAPKPEPYEAPPLVRLFLRRHPEARPPED